MLRIDPLGPPESTRTYVFSFDDKYAKYFSVALQSLISHARADYLYDIIVLHDCVSQRNSSVLQGSIPGNFSLRFFNVGDLAREILIDLDAKVSHNRWDASTFYDLLVPLVMPEYERVLYCDSDLVFCDDSDELFRMSFEGMPLIAVRDTLGLALEFNPEWDYLVSQRAFIDESIGLSDLRGYFNGGVLLFNIPAIDADEYLARIKEAFCFPTLPTVDQDVLNYVFADRVTIAPQRFNVQVHLMDFVRPQEASAELQEYLEAMRCPVIAHYTTSRKPWRYPDCWLAERFWLYARCSPYYESIIYENVLFAQREAGARFSVKKLVKSGILSRVAIGRRRIQHKKEFDEQKRLYAIARWSL